MRCRFIRRSSSAVSAANAARFGATIELSHLGAQKGQHLLGCLRHSVLRRHGFEQCRQPADVFGYYDAESGGLAPASQVPPPGDWPMAARGGDNDHGSAEISQHERTPDGVHEGSARTHTTGRPVRRLAAQHRGGHPGIATPANSQAGRADQPNGAADPGPCQDTPSRLDGGNPP